MSSCEDDLETAQHMVEAAAKRLFDTCPTDELVQPWVKPGVSDEVWAQLLERFGDKSGQWDGQPACAHAVFWQNYARAMDARANELAKATT